MMFVDQLTPEEDNRGQPGIGSGFARTRPGQEESDGWVEPSAGTSPPSLCSLYDSRRQ